MAIKKTIFKTILKTIETDKLRLKAIITKSILNENDLFWIEHGNVFLYNKANIRGAILKALDIVHDADAVVNNIDNSYQVFKDVTDFTNFLENEIVRFGYETADEIIGKLIEGEN